MICLVTFETRHFTFTVLAANREEGVEKLREAWKTHARQTGADPGYFDEYADDVNSVPMTVGTVYRDGESVGEGT